MGHFLWFAFLYTLPVWLITGITLLAALIFKTTGKKRFFVSPSPGMHMLRAFILITIGSYWFINVPLDKLIFLKTLNTMLTKGIEYTALYALIYFVANVFTRKTYSNLEIPKKEEKPRSIN